ncbi:MAG: hypothetical protein ACFCVB_12495 [Nodosilinea sp.]
MDRLPPTCSPKSVVYLLALGALGLTACGNRLDTGSTEAMIKADIERQGRRLSLKAVRCPSDVTRQAEAYFRCVGELDPEGTFTINVTQLDSQGNVTWEVPNSKVLLNLPKVEDTIQQGLAQVYGQRSQIDCGTATYRVNQPGDRFQCQVVGGLETATATIESVLVSITADGNLTWQETQAAVAALPATAPGAQTTAGAGAAAPAPPAAPQAAAADSPVVKTTTVTGPTGRVINRPYVRGDND